MGLYDPASDAITTAPGPPSRAVLNIGAGTGSYEPPDREVVAVEPSAAMHAQRPPSASPCIDAEAESPFEDGAVDAAMAVLSDQRLARSDRGGLWAVAPAQPVSVSRVSRLRATTAAPFGLDRQPGTS